MNKIIMGDCMEEMKKISENSIDGLVTDPPYGISFMQKDWDSFSSSKQFQLWTEQWGKEALRILKPGAFGFVFGIPQLVHRVAIGLEDAGFEIRTQLMWMFFSNMPKGQDIAKQFDKDNGFEIKLNKNKLKIAPDGKPYKDSVKLGSYKFTNVYAEDGPTFENDESAWYEYEPISEEAKQWNGYKMCLKSAYEPILLIRKPLEGTYIENIRKWNVGVLNIDACRIPFNVETEPDNRIRDAGRNFKRTTKDASSMFFGEDREYLNQCYDLKGRYPTNIIIDEMMAELMNKISGTENGSGKITFQSEVSRKGLTEDTVFNKNNSGFKPPNEGICNYNDGEGWSKYFYKVPFKYCPKAHPNEKNLGLADINPKRRDKSRIKPIDNPFNRNEPKKNFHATVKPLKLMTYLIRMIKPPIERPVILDPFLGSGTTAIACKIENCDCIGIEKNPEYHEIIKKRLAIPLKKFEKYTESVVPAEGQTKLTDFRSWL